MGSLMTYPNFGTENWVLRTYLNKDSFNTPGEQTGTAHNPISFKITRRFEEKYGWTAVIPYSDVVTYRSYMTLRHNSATPLYYLYGVVREIVPSYDGPGIQTLTLSGYCSLQELSDSSVEELEIFEFAYRVPEKIVRIRKHNGVPGGQSAADSETEETVPINWRAPSFTGNTQLNNSADGIDAWYFGSLVPFKGIELNITTAMQANGGFNYDQFKVEYLHGVEEWEPALVRDYQTPANNTGTDNTNALSTTGTNTILFDHDPSGGWVKHSQSGDRLFWCRIWFREGTSPDESSTSAVISSVRLLQRVAVSDAISRLDAILPGTWTATGGPTQDDLYHHFRGETVIEAATKIARMTGGTWYSVTPQIFTADGTIKFLATPDEASTVSATLDPSVPSMTKLRGKRIPPEATRIRLFGSGHGQATITAALQDGTVSLPSGYTYNASENLLVNTTAEAAHEVIVQKDAKFSWVSSLFAAGQSIEASNQLLRMGIRLLQKASLLDREHYIVESSNVDLGIDLGDKVRLIYSYGSKTIDSEFYIVGWDTDFRASAQGKVTTNTYHLSPDGYDIDSAGGRVSLDLSDGKDSERYRQPIWEGDVQGSAGGSGGGVEGYDNLGNHTAEQDLDMGSFDITNVGDVDGVDVSALKSDFDSHEADEDNPHSVDHSDIGNHSGDVSGGLVLTIQAQAISNRVLTTISSADRILYQDMSDGGALKKGLISDIIDMITGATKTWTTITKPAAYSGWTVKQTLEYAVHNRVLYFRGAILEGGETATWSPDDPLLTLGSANRPDEIETRAIAASDSAVDDADEDDWQSDGGGALVVRTNGEVLIRGHATYFNIGCSIALD